MWYTVYITQKEIFVQQKSKSKKSWKSKINVKYWYNNFFKYIKKIIIYILCVYHR